MAQTTFHWDSCAITNVGKVRKINEDAVLDNNEASLWVVADGMGGHAAGDVASSSIVNALREIRPSEDLPALITEVEEVILAVNRDLIRQANERVDRQTMGSTIAALLAHGDHCFCLWAGDSRVYRLRGDEFKRITVDHSKVQDLVDEGIIDEEDAESHPEANVITRAVGANDELFVDMDIFDVKDGDIYLVCSDGLFKELRESEIAEIMAGKPPEQSGQELVDLTLDRGSRDNVTVIVIHAHANKPS